jgi:hypothetical protein
METRETLLTRLTGSCPAGLSRTIQWKSDLKIHRIVTFLTRVILTSFLSSYCILEPHDVSLATHLHLSSLIIPPRACR